MTLISCVDTLGVDPSLAMRQLKECVEMHSLEHPMEKGKQETKEKTAMKILVRLSIRLQVLSIDRVDHDSECTRILVFQETARIVPRIQVQ